MARYGHIKYASLTKDQAYTVIEHLLTVKRPYGLSFQMIWDSDLNELRINYSAHDEDQETNIKNAIKQRVYNAFKVLPDVEETRMSLYIAIKTSVEDFQANRLTKRQLASQINESLNNASQCLTADHADKLKKLINHLGFRTLKELREWAAK